MTNTPMTSREAFEAWFLGENTHVVLKQDKDGNYLYSSAYSAWQAFNAGYQSCEQKNQAVIGGDLSEWLKDGEKVIERLAREREDVSSSIGMLATERKKVEAQAQTIAELVEALDRNRLYWRKSPYANLALDALAKVKGK